MVCMSVVGRYELMIFAHSAKKSLSFERVKLAY